MTLRYSTDIVIFGGGVAGLWLLNLLRQRGYGVILLEANCVGGGQTIASQGIIHGGLKYALSGKLTGASLAIADLPARWHRCLRGEEEPDLRGVRLLSEHYYMWSTGGVGSRLKTYLGSKTLRGRIESVPQCDYPEFFARAAGNGKLYRLPDFVIDTPSLIAKLADKHQDSIFQASPEAVTFRHDAAGLIDAVAIDSNGKQLLLSPQRLIFCAGEGNQALIEQARLQGPQCQLRPLNMVFLKHRELPEAYVHCVGDEFSLTPALTITSHRDSDGSNVWYLGGELAETGVGKSDDEQIDRARDMLGQMFPALSLLDASWGCVAINRAEARVESAYRPDDAWLEQEQNVLVAWPTKLTLTPSLADKLLQRLEDEAVATVADDPHLLDQFLEKPAIASALWDQGQRYGYG